MNNYIPRFIAVALCIFFLFGCTQGSFISREQALDAMSGVYPICTDAIPATLGLYDLDNGIFLSEASAKLVESGKLPSGYFGPDLAWRWTIDVGGDYIYNCQTTLDGKVSQEEIERD